MTICLPGSSVVFGVPCKVSAELMMDGINAVGAAVGVKPMSTLNEDGIGIEKPLSDDYRLMHPEGLRFTLESISRGVRSLRVESAIIVAIISLARLGRAFDVSPGALYLASDASEFITGIEFPVDAGRTI